MILIIVLEKHIFINIISTVAYILQFVEIILTQISYLQILLQCGISFYNTQLYFQCYILDNIYGYRK